MENYLFLIYGLIALNVLLLGWIIYLEYRLKKVFKGKAVSSLESLIGELGSTVDSVLKNRDEDKALFEDIYKRLKRTLQNTHTLRFNPFADHGGNQSFATAIMDEDGNGVVISSLYSRDKVGVYAKPLLKFSSSYELSTEEKESIQKARLPKS